MSYEVQTLIEQGEEVGLKLTFEERPKDWRGYNFEWKGWKAYYKEKMLFETDGLREMRCFVTGWKQRLLAAAL